ncbi:MAG: ABC transporter permease, partial [Rickettsiales bacterium]
MMKKSLRAVANALKFLMVNYVNITSRIAFRELMGGWKSLITFYLLVIISLVVIAVMGEISENVKYNITSKSKEVLGGDIEISLANFPLGAAEQKFLQQFGKVSTAIDLRAMMRFKNESRMVELKAVDDNYPLYGDVVVTQSRISTLHLKNGVFVAQQLVDDIGFGVNDEITIGRASIKILGIIESEPDWLVNNIILGPRVLTTEEALEDTGLLNPGSLLKYHYRIALTKDQNLHDVLDKIKTTYPTGAWIIRDAESEDSVVDFTIERLKFFVMLAGIFNLLICGIGIAVATKFFMQKKLLNIAILKSLGATQKIIFISYAQMLLYLWIDTSISGSLIAWLATHLFIPYLQDFLPYLTTTKFFAQPILKAILFSFLIIATFSLPALISAMEIKPIRLFRGIGFLRYNLDKRTIFTFSICAILITGLLLVDSVDRKFTFIFLGFIFVATCFFVGLGKVIKFLARTIRFKTPWMRLAMANIYRQGSSVYTILLSTGIGFAILILLLNVERNIRYELEEGIIKKAPSLFLVDVLPEQLPLLKKLLEENFHVTNFRAEPNVQGIITHINGVAVDKSNIDKSALWAINGHRRLSYTSDAPNNPIIKGKWWSKDYKGPPIISLDSRIADGMKLKLGDTMSFNILGERVDATISNLRKVQYTNFNINFAVIFNEGVLEKFPKSFFVTFKTEQETKIIDKVSETFPNVVSLRTQDGIKLAEKTIAEIVTAIEVIVIICLVSGLIV